MKQVSIVQAACAAAAALGVPLAYGAVVVLGADPRTAGDAAACTQLFALTGLVAAPLIFREPGEPAFSAGVLERICITWLLISGLTHVTWELSWCLMHSRLHDVGPEDTWAWFWWIYGVADRRFLTSDPFVVAREWMCALVEGPANLVLAYLMWRKRALAAASLALIVVSTMEITGTVLYIAAEAVNGFRNINPSFVDFWVKFVLLASFWIVVPAVSVVSAAFALRERRPAEPAAAETPPVPALGWK